MVYYGNNDACYYEWSPYFYRSRNRDSTETTPIPRRSTNRNGNVVDFDDRHGGSDEYHRCRIDRRCDVDTGSRHPDVDCRLPDSLAVQLLETQEIRGSMSLRYLYAELGETRIGYLRMDT